MQGIAVFPCIWRSAMVICLIPGPRVVRVQFGGSTFNQAEQSSASPDRTGFW